MLFQQILLRTALLALVGAAAVDNYGWFHGLALAAAVHLLMPNRVVQMTKGKQSW